MINNHNDILKNLFVHKVIKELLRRVAASCGGSDSDTKDNDVDQMTFFKRERVSRASMRHFVVVVVVLSTTLPI